MLSHKPSKPPRAHSNRTKVKTRQPFKPRSKSAQLLHTTSQSRPKRAQQITTLLSAPPPSLLSTPVSIPPFKSPHFTRSPLLRLTRPFSTNPPGQPGFKSTKPQPGPTTSQSGQNTNQSSPNTSFAAGLKKKLGEHKVLSLFREYGGIAVGVFAASYLVMSSACVAACCFIPQFDAQEFINAVESKEMLKPFVENGKRYVTQTLAVFPAFEALVMQNPQRSLNIAAGLLINEMLGPVRAVMAIAITKKIGDLRKSKPVEPTVDQV